MPADADDDGSCTAQRPLVFVGGYSEPQGHIKGDQLLDGVRSFCTCTSIFSISRTTAS